MLLAHRPYLLFSYFFHIYFVAIVVIWSTLMNQLQIVILSSRMKSHQNTYPARVQSSYLRWTLFQSSSFQWTPLFVNSSPIKSCLRSTRSGRIVKPPVRFKDFVT